MLGDRIRKLRKQKKLTLEALAGLGLTKGMLSLIENNKAQPSMESLAYIAEGLGVEVTDLLEEVSTLELREVLEKAEKLYNEKKEKATDKYKQLLTLLEPYIKNLPQGYEAARLLDIYSRSLYEEKRFGWEELSNQAATMYDKMNVTANRAQIAIFRSMVKFIEHDYSNALEILLSERTEIESNHVYIDPMTQVDLDYTEAILYFAVGEYETASHVMENALIFSKKHRIFYRTDDLYRIGAGQAMMFRDKEKRELYLRKLKQYGEFAEDTLSILVHNLLIAMTLIAENKEYARALEILDQYLGNPQEEEVVEWLYRMEKGKAFYGLGKFTEAIHEFEKVETPTTTHHPFDLSLFYVRYSYKALCHFKLGEMENALQSAELAVKKFENIPYLPFKEFAIETYNAILAKINPVQN
ncbi:transcriptional regulator with XRE-family HTH domain [Bacillus niacini]|uniref:Transcriptional regulator with XRE-family HTH domain n=1 Tax=Neobacillus niacini TaxID=86668 RepID=A0A852T4A0_9BACI|nr:helix-turn-helix transcriptional regulator [Neobacillus niacini]NYE03520.1 transcriptional regulator with XRE-family HTH domain [Neobacillus niacini]